MNPDPRLPRLGARAAGLFPASVVVAVAAPCDFATLHPAEAAGIARAVPDRQREFAGGRAAARIAQHRLGRVPLPVPMGADRAPVWPEGLRGSITHAGGLCLAAVTDDPRIEALGLDLEVDESLPDGVAAEVLLPVEAGMPGRVVFSAKETVFKALYPTVGAVFGFEAVRVLVEGDRFGAETLVRLGPLAPGLRLSGRLWRGDGLILTALAL